MQSANTDGVSPEIQDTIEKAARAVSDADAVVIGAGAGIGVDSGLPDFRGNEGFWNAYPPIRKLGYSFVEMANPQWFGINPRVAWAFYGHRLNLYRETEPHAGFYLLREIADSKPGGYFVFTSNVDGQFQKAGFDENRIEECHGSIHHLQCCAHCSNEIWSADGAEVIIDMEAFEAAEPLPACKDCGRLARPNVLMFGDWEWLSQRSSAQGSRFADWLRIVRDGGMKLVVIETGAGTAVPTVRWRSESLAGSHGATIVRINPRDHSVPEGHISIPLGSRKGVERIHTLLAGS